MTRGIRRRCDWPALFWRRAASSYAENDLVCRTCLGSGCGESCGSAWEGITVEDAACPSCRSSGLLVPTRELPDDVEAVWAADDAGGCWLDWLGREGGGLVFSDGNALAFMRNGSVLAGLFSLSEAGPRHLAEVFRLACGTRLLLTSHYLFCEEVAPFRWSAPCSRLEIFRPGATCSVVRITATA